VQSTYGIELKEPEAKADNSGAQPPKWSEGPSGSRFVCVHMHMTAFSEVLTLQSVVFW